MRSPRASQQLGEEIGRGSSGKVYRALNRETGDFRAIKEIPTRNMQTGHLEAVQSEIDLLHNLQHDKHNLSSAGVMRHATMPNRLHPWRRMMLPLTLGLPSWEATKKTASLR